MLAFAACALLPSRRMIGVAAFQFHSVTRNPHVVRQSRFRNVVLFSAEGDASGKARVVFLGTPDVAAESLKAIVGDSKKEESSYEVVGVITQPPKRRKRGKVTPSPVGLVAEELDLPVLCPEKAKDPNFLDELENTLRPDLCITAAYGQYLPKRFLAMPKYGTLNIHPSLLPRWRGASPVQRSLEAGDDPLGVSVLFTVSKMDAGPIVSQDESKVDHNEQATVVLPHLFNIGTDLLLKALPKVINGEITMETATIQNEEQVTLAKMIDSSEGELKVWKDSATTCHNKVRAFSDWPGTYMFFRYGDDDTVDPVKVKIIKTQVLDETAEQTSTIQLGPKKGDGLRIVCADGAVLECLLVQPATRKVMDAKSLVNGLQGKAIKWVQTPDEEEQVDE
eukprot:CAMPEP_0185725180 /NCGR_PEP_ID=MMETSP1171-20130828/1482_1 /TAXON_ID=374046 /ORGANISM="Helicotheca tamensis, Strain CCMP826" /LENGTH=392 /DNA_ID=CAMNT_0028393227 /DNA_START=42 /DNA_END=1220 /DNA_ORIENTATION=-